jgi:hydroxyethylthiazole kinase-like uncharacterized protein yjeF
MALPILSIAQMRAWEQATWDSGHAESEVIRRVGLAVAQSALRLTHPGDHVLILAGKGHNGDDARAAAANLDGRAVELLAIQDPANDLSQLKSRLATRPQLVIDGLFGIGLSRPLDDAWCALIRHINASGVRVLSVDVPSGLNADSGQAEGAAIEAGFTLTVGAPKKGLLERAAWSHVGRLEVAEDVGLGPCPQLGDLQWTQALDFDGLVPARSVASHKGDFGHVAIIAGSLGYQGAAVLAARGALRARPGLVTLFTPDSVHTAVASQLQAPMVHPWRPGLDLGAKFSAVLVGPGLAGPDVTETMRQMVRRLWTDLPVPVVVDASALDWLPSGGGAKNVLRVITPHPGEAARLLKGNPGEVQSDRPRALRILSRHCGTSVVVLKGHQTLIGRSDGAIHVNPTGTPSLAQGGAGDVLGGFIVGLLAQPALAVDGMRAVRFGVWRHGEAAERLDALRPGWGVEDLPEGLGLDMPRCPGTAGEGGG